MADLAGNMWRDAGLPQIRDETGAVVSLVGPKGQIGLHDQTVAVFHEGMPHETQYRASARRLLEQPCVRVGGRGMGGIRALSPRKSISVLWLRWTERVNGAFLGWR